MMTADISVPDAVLRALRNGEVVAFPTDTVWGIGVSVEGASSPQLLSTAKGRPESKPVAWLVASVDDLARYGRDVPSYAQELARQGWPGALTLVVRASEEVPAGFRAADGTIALRMPDSPEALALIEAAGGPIAATSANATGQEPPRDLCSIDPELLSRCSAIMTSGSRGTGDPSAIIDCTGAAPLRLR